MSTDDSVRILVGSARADLLRRALSRRRVLGLAALAAGSPLLAGCGTRELSIYTWGDYDDPRVLKDFDSNMSASYELFSYDSNEELIAKLRDPASAGRYDIVVPTGSYISMMIEEGLLWQLDKKHIPNLTKVAAQFRGQMWDPGSDYSICKAWGTTGFLYDRHLITRRMRTWGDFIEAMRHEASGRTSVLDDPADLAGLYFWSHGIDWNTEDEADYDAYEKWAMAECAPHVVLDSDPVAEVGPSKTDYSLIQIWNGDARLGLIQDADPDRWKWVLPRPVTEFWMDNWCIPKGARNPEAAHAFINYVLDPEISFRELNYTGNDTGVSGMEDLAKRRGIVRPEMIFFEHDEMARMRAGVVNSAQERRTKIATAVRERTGR